jgi:hypothetical protein
LAYPTCATPLRSIDETAEPNRGLPIEPTGKSRFLRNPD